MLTENSFQLVFIIIQKSDEPDNPDCTWEEEGQF